MNGAAAVAADDIVVVVGGTTKEALRVGEGGDTVEGDEEADVGKGEDLDSGCSADEGEIDKGNEGEGEEEGCFPRSSISFNNEGETVGGRLYEELRLPVNK